jgi:hypothetical protein
MERGNRRGRREKRRKRRGRTAAGGYHQRKRTM